MRAAAASKNDKNVQQMHEAEHNLAMARLNPSMERAEEIKKHAVHQLNQARAELTNVNQIYERLEVRKNENDLLQDTIFELMKNHAEEVASIKAQMEARECELMTLVKAGKAEIQARDERLTEAKHRHEKNVKKAEFHHQESKKKIEALLIENDELRLKIHEM